ncbi:MAG: NusG domain II-containing protein [Gammaproteobacteria bacterium]|nr:NusG domain II-containing protein [Gammaproteobacteria bacterium]MCK5091946.1 NusG domain II-containing protein [Gammaproteobacteria bacterium]
MSKMGKLLTTADKVLLSCTVLLLPFLYFSAWSQDLQADSVKIWSSSQGFQTFTLNQKQQILIDGAHGKSVFEIQNGKIRFVDSKCTNKICVRAGWLSHAGAFAACLPNNVSMEITGTTGYDSINF